MVCSNCDVHHPIEDQGMVRIRPAASRVISLLEQDGFQPVNVAEYSQLQFHSREQLLHLLKCLTQSPGTHTEEEVFINITNSRERIPSDSFIWMPLSQMEARLKHSGIVDIILGERFTSHMQPIVDMNEEIVGYEFLLRASSLEYPFEALELFEIARQTGLHSFLDLAARLRAIEISANCLPRGYKRFINFLPSSIYNPKHCLNQTFRAIERLELQPSDFVFEVVETEKIHMMPHLTDIFQEYRKNGSSVALDDVGSGYSTIEEMIRLKPDYVKIDRSLVHGCSKDERKQSQIRNILRHAHDFGGHVLTEGIELYEDFDFCRSAGVELAQGYLFGEAAPQPKIYMESDTAVGD